MPWSERHARDIPEATGRIYRYSTDGQLRRMADDRCGIAHTLVWPEPDLLVVGDTVQTTLASTASKEIAHTLRLWQAGLDRLFVTPARFTMSAAHLQTAPQDGGLSGLPTPARGKPPNRFGPM